MLSNDTRRQRRPLLQAPIIVSMLKKSTPGTFSPETTATTSSGYSTGGSSVSNTKELRSKKSSLTARRQQCHQQQQYKTQSKGKKAQEQSTRSERVYLRSSFFDKVALKMTFSIYLYSIPSSKYCIYLSFCSLTHTQKKKKKKYKYCTNLSVYRPWKELLVPVVFFNVNIDRFSIIPPTILHNLSILITMFCFSLCLSRISQSSVET